MIEILLIISCIIIWLAVLSKIKKDKQTQDYTKRKDLFCQKFPKLVVQENWTLLYKRGKLGSKLIYKPEGWKAICTTRFSSYSRIETCWKLDEIFKLGMSIHEQEIFQNVLEEIFNYYYQFVEKQKQEKILSNKQLLIERTN